MNYTLITGASTGIGKDFALLYAQKKQNLILVARNLVTLELLANELKTAYVGIEIECIAMDLSVSGAAKKVFDEVQSKNLSVNRLINNAGIGLQGAFVDISLEDQEKMLQLNVTALMQLTHYFAQDMKQNKQGDILNVASTAAFQAGPYMAVYYASKAFVVSFSEALHNELRDEGVTVSVLCPGATKTEFFNPDRNLKLPSGAMASMDVAKIGVNALDSKKRMVISGVINNIMVQSLRTTPRFIAIKVAQFFNTKLLS